MAGYDLDFEDDGASWRIRRERYLNGLVERAYREQSRAMRFLRMMLIPPLICGAVFLGTVVVAVVATVTGATASVDLTKPMHIAAGAPVCPTADDVQALYKHAPNQCGTARDDLPVAMMENAGAAGPYRVRLLDPKESIKDYWVPYVSLAN